MNITDKIKAKLAKHSGVNFRIEGTTISIDATSKSGFTVWLTDNNPGYTVGYDGWHEEFTDDDEALNCFTLGLRNSCRLKVPKRGETDCSWTVETRDSDEWRPDSSTHLVFVPFWRKKSIEYRQNSLISEVEQAGAEDGELL